MTRPAGSSPGAPGDALDEAATLERVRSRLLGVGPSRAAQIGRFYLLDRIGEGGMGVVWSAFDPRLDRKVAIKILRTNEEAAQASLREEARTLARLRHPNLVVVHEVGTVGEQIFVAMEFVEGLSLRSWLANERPKGREILDAFRQAGQALEAAHAAGIVHRDFKPDNVRREPQGRVVVVDFGLARDTDGPISQQSEGSSDVTSAAGTPGYMAPEQHGPHSASPAADQYAFAASLYEALQGRLPATSDGEDELPTSLLWNDTPLTKGLGIPLQSILEKALRRSPEARYGSMTELLSAMQPRQPAWRKWWVPIATVSLLAGGVIWQSARPPTPESAIDPCEILTAALDEDCSPDVRRQLAAKWSAHPGFSELAGRLEQIHGVYKERMWSACDCLLYTSDAADE